MASAVTCKSCGKPVAAGDKFCPGCGTAVTLADETVQAPAMQEAGTNVTQCAKCGAPMGRDDRFCPQCGASRPEAATVVSHVSLRNAQATRLIAATKGEFEILEQLGTGAMGAVYLAKDIALSRKVAIKVIAPHLLSDDTMVSRFRMEAQTVASLRHPNIVNVHAVRQADDLHYFVMEFIDGPPLRNMVKQNAPIEVDVVQSIMFQVGSALSYAHRSGGGVIHRDVKPANIMVDREGDAFVTDFGISKIAESQSGLTQTGATIGTPEYMSPEQCRGEALTGASDQYALGIVAYEMLCGHTPFTGTQYHIMVAHTTEAAKPIREVRGDVPAHVAEAVERMLAKDPGARWPDLDAAVVAMGGTPLGYHDPVRHKIKALTGATLMHVPAVGAGSRSGGASGARGTLDTATSVSVLGIPSVLETGERIQLRADVRGADNTSLGSLGVIWASTDPAIAKVEAGWVEGLKPGTVSIMASAGNVASSVLLTVAEPAPAKLLVRPGSINMQRGGRIGLTAEVQDKRGRRLEREIRWRSSDPGVATVSASGEVTARGSGPVTITAETEGAKGTAEVVVEAPVGAAAAAGGSASAEPPAPAREKSAAAPRRPAAARPKPTTRAKPAPAGGRRPLAIAAVLVLLVGAGVAGVTMFGGGDGSTVPPTTSVGGGTGSAGGGDAPGGGGTSTPGTQGGSANTGGTPSPTSGSPGSAAGGVPPGTAPAALAGGASPGASTPGGATTSPAQTDPDPPQQVTAGGGRARGGRGGQTQTAGRGNPATATPPPKPARVALNVPERSMDVGDTQTANARVFASGGAPMGPGTYSLAWRSSDGSVVSVDAQGRLRAGSPGRAWIVGSAGSAGDSVLINVAAAVASVEIAQQDFTVEAGTQPRTLRASALDQARRPVAGDVTWTSSNPAVARVDASGTVTPVAPGTAQITASAAGFSDQVTVSVTEPPPALPSVEQARAAIQAYAAALGERDRALVTRLWGGGDARRRDELLELFDQNSFSASLGNVGAPTQGPGGVVVPFQVTLSWRTNFGQNRSRDFSFAGRLERVGADWQLSGIVPR